ncbi:gamma-butyrolactone-binding protein [Streptomyces capoamus]|uniref:Gamma-butyrolactone-binding protein n=1 Tax=Streptomyces capoamus TaxID=68183 RepID=A0A919KES5_9ACTN|nr:ScbR family autoregulator-binding transcription factor [Streptomyces capoamus]GGW20912.1 gamma-butyrolactone-binding protein [Streptomyces libani subsp. rufus]GHG66804.1 gamma-butyrolactone-binding protein [Streptomyces capoamus]
MTTANTERATRTRQRLLLAAAEIFDEAGYEGAAVTRIAERAGLTLGALYFHFGSKQGVAEALMNAQATTIEPHLDSTGLQRLVDITLVWAHRMQHDPILRAGVRLAVEQGSHGMNDATSFEDWRTLMRGLLETAQAEGELEDGVDTDRVARFIVAACTGMQVYSQLATGRADLTERVCDMWALLLPSIAPAAVHANISVDPQQVPAS